jgi:hypothetical protein
MTTADDLSQLGRGHADGTQEVQMDSNFPPIRSDVVTVPSVARPTPTPTRVTFGEVLSKGASTLASGAEAAMEALPGGPLVAAAIRGGSSVNSGPSSPMMSGNLGALSSNAEGPATLTSVGGGFGASGAGAASGAASSTGVPTGSIDSSLQQSQEMNLYFLQIQQEVNTQNETFTTLSNVMKTEADTVKNAIGNLH